MRIYLGPSLSMTGILEGIPMNEKPEAVEPSFAEAIEAVTAATELPLHTRRQWCSALRGLARCLDRPVESVPARFSAVRNKMLALKYPPFGWTAKTLANTPARAECVQDLVYL
jgi:hypothetical protein